MTDRLTAAGVFAKTILALAPYAEDIVFIGGWVHALYLAEANEGAHALFTDDIDVTIPPSLLTAGRPTLLALAGGAGFDVEKERDDAPIEVVQYASDNSPIYLDILTEHPNPREPVKIEGQPDLLAQGYPGQHLLLENSRVMMVGPDIHPTLSPPQRIRAPMLGAYVLHKVLSSMTRGRQDKAVKDLVYVHEILRHPRLGAQARSELPTLVRRYPEEAEQWRERLDEVLRRSGLRRDIAEQLLLARRAFGEEEQIMAQIEAQVRRVLAEVR